MPVRAELYPSLVIIMYPSGISCILLGYPASCTYQVIEIFIAVPGLYILCLLHNNGTEYQVVLMWGSFVTTAELVSL